MRELVLRASDDHVASLAHESDPVRAVIELVWNAIDAEATTVSVESERTAMDAISRVRVSDNGHGISSDEVESTFGRIPACQGELSPLVHSNPT
ncbi:MAG TPA: ATP-binding protein [Mycobacterium sp.]|nr:ATP-binding protein [Mycobacterium sp.]